MTLLSILQKFLNLPVAQETWAPHWSSRQNWLAKGPGIFPREAWPRLTLNPRDLQAAPFGKVMTFAMTPLAISSTAMRALAAEAASLRYLTPDPVVEFIRSRNLYAPARDPREAANPATSR